ncbi:MAG: hypothetical protein SWH54_05695, partial [Thermodesulfobacteriota bacterium]|nr:hypothetical protein [Thermodesulfobacteriota bacterium]
LSNCNLGLWLFLGIASSIVFEEAISHIIFYVNVLMKLCTRRRPESGDPLLNLLVRQRQFLLLIRVTNHRRLEFSVL